MLLLLMTLGGNPPEWVAPPVPAAPIIGGEVTEPGEFDEVVALSVGNNLCTGTLVASDLVVTAAHCVEAARDSIVVFWGSELVESNSISSSEWAPHPSYCPECKKNAYDFGYVLLPQALDFEPARPLVDQDEWDESMHRDGSVELVGYGTTDESSGGNAGLGVKRKVTTAIHSFTSGGLEFFAGGEGRDSCKGDSGGPAFVRTGSQQDRLAGILSRGTTPCGGGGYYGTPYTALCWLRDETAVDLLPDGCEACDCLERSEPDQGGCRVVLRSDMPMIVWLGLGATVFRRRRSPNPERQ